MDISDVMDGAMHAYREAGLGECVALVIGRTDLAALIRESAEWAVGFRNQQRIEKSEIVYCDKPVFVVDLAVGCVAVGERLLEQWRAMGVVSRP